MSAEARARAVDTNAARAEVEKLKRSVAARRPALRIALRKDAEACARHLRMTVPPGRLGLLRGMISLWRVSEDYPAVVLYRLRCWCEDRGLPLIPFVLRGVLRMGYSVRIGRYVVIAEGLHIPHGNVVIDGFMTIGRNCVIAPWASIGLQIGNLTGPKIGDNVFVGTGARILGDFAIGPGAVIGAGAVVLTEVAAGTTVAGVPARPISSSETPEPR